nr:hypothetical protein [Tanacetum cinerariifolium]
MERKWMYGMNISDPEYVNGVQSFLIAAESDRVAKGNIEIFCPHGNLNEMLHDLDANDGDINQEDLQQLFEDTKKHGYGINQFGNMSSHYSTWPVLLCMYNLPPWLCMKRKYIMMSLLISIPKQPGNDIDVCLSPLINDMKTLWKPGVEMYDAYIKEKFRLHAMIFCTIKDYPAYGNLSGYNTKGKQACPICEDETSSRWLDNCKKNRVHGLSKIASK